MIKTKKNGEWKLLTGIDFDMRTFSYFIFSLFFLVHYPAFAVDITAFAYHDITLKKTADPYAITVSEFERQMSYLERHRYQPISLNLLDQVRRGEASLPEKPVLLTFDDGLLSYYEHAFPVLEKYKYPSIVNVVSAWTDKREYPDEYERNFMSWDQLREVSRSPLVEILSHTDNLHHGIIGTPQGDLLPVAVARAYDLKTKSYEDEIKFQRRIAQDLLHSQNRIKKELNISPKGIVWPYGRYDGVLVEEAAKLGMPYHLTLENEPARIENLPRIDRITWVNYKGLGNFRDGLNHTTYYKEQSRFIDVDMAIFSGKSEEEQNHLLSSLLDRLELLRVNAILLSPFTENHKRAFFYNTIMPIEADLLNHVTHRIDRRTGIQKIYLKLPAKFLSSRYDKLRDELVRMNKFKGLIVMGQPTEAEMTRARTLFSYYRPTIKIGVEKGSDVKNADFRLIEVNPALDKKEITQLVDESLTKHQRVLFLINRASNNTDQKLREVMRNLRSAGAEHYGYNEDDFIRNTPDVMKIVGDLTEHTIVKTLRR